MSNRETYSEIHATLDSFKAPSVGEGAITISERIRGLVGPAAAALHEAGFVVGDGTLAEAIRTLAKRADERADRFLAALAEEQERTAFALRALAERDERAHVAESRADRMDAQWAAAERRATSLEEEAQRLRADVERLGAQLDYATALCLAGFRQ